MRSLAQTDRRLWVDDLRPAPSGWDHVTSYPAFVEYIRTVGMPAFISFDHDLGAIPGLTVDENTGDRCARYLLDCYLGLPAQGWEVHSQNTVEAANIRFTLESYARYIQRHGCDR